MLDQNDVLVGLLLAATMIAVLITNTWTNLAPEPAAQQTTQTSQQQNGSLVKAPGAVITAPPKQPLPIVTKQENSMSNSDIVNITMTTSLGDIKLELYADKAPLTVANFVSYAEEGFYNDTIFHRVIDGFMIQGGGFTADFSQKPTKDHLQNEADNGLKNDHGTIAMARTPDPHSATAQFFINVSDNDFLNFRSADSNGYGYAVFGKVVGGLDVVKAIQSVATGSGGPMPTDVPQETVAITAVTVD